jgi:hypothetical protein
MALFSKLFLFLDTFFGGWLGLTMIQLYVDTSSALLPMAERIDKNIQIGFTLIGMAYFILKGIDDYKMRKLERQEKHLQNQLLEEELIDKHKDDV